MQGQFNFILLSSLTFVFISSSSFTTPHTPPLASQHINHQNISFYQIARENISKLEIQTIKYHGRTYFCKPFDFLQIFIAIEAAQI